MDTPAPALPPKRPLRRSPIAAASCLYLPRFAAEALAHHLRKRQARRRQRAARPHAVARGPTRRFRLASLGQRARSIEHDAAEARDGRIGRRQMLTRAIGDQPLAVLRQRILLGNAVDAGERAVLLLLAVDQVVV